MPENTGTPGTADTKASPFDELRKAATCLFAAVDEEVAKDVRAKVEAALNAHEETEKQLTKVEELLTTVNKCLDGHDSIFPGSHLHEDIHLIMTGKQL